MFSRLWRRASRSEPPWDDAQVTYDWPADGGEPFDVSDAETRWLLVASRGLGRTWPAGDLRDFGSTHPDFESRVPVGYQVIQVAERLAVVDRGRVLREWPVTGLEVSATERLVVRRPPTGGQTFTVVDGGLSRSAAGAPQVARHHDRYDDAVAQAVSLRDRRALVVRVLVTTNWH